eukprot:scaffold67012_cov72-Phaeocystis_antarctica.AAC.1
MDESPSGGGPSSVSGHHSESCPRQGPNAFEPRVAYEGLVERSARELGKPLHDREGADEGSEHCVRELGGELERATPVKGRVGR